MLTAIMWDLPHRMLDFKKLWSSSVIYKQVLGWGIRLIKSASLEAEIKQHYDLTTFEI